jgi:hypothetical protein
MTCTGGNSSPARIRRQGMTARDYSRLLERLAQEFPTESFLILRYGDHQPQFGLRIIEPSLSKEALAHAPYLPLVIQEAAGVPLDPSFSEQKEILQRCDGVFYRCRSGREARRFNRLLIRAGLVKGL